MKKMRLFGIVLLLIVGFLSNGSLAQDWTRWQLPEGAKMRLGKGKVNDITFSRDGTRFAVATTIGIWIYEARTGEAIALLTGHKQTVKTVAFSLDGRALTSVDAGGETRLWDATTGELRSVLMEATDLVEEVFLSSDSTRLVTANIDHTFRLWHFGDGTQQPILIDDTEQRVLTLALSPDGRILASSKVPHHNSVSMTHVENFRLQVRDTSTQKMLFSLAGDTLQIHTLAFSPDGRTLAGLDIEGNVQLWDVDTWTSRIIIKGKGDEVSPHTLEFSPDSKHLAISDFFDGKVCLWDTTEAAQGEPRQEFRVHGESVYALAFSPDGKTLLTASESGTLHAWDTTTGNQRFTITEHIGPLLNLTFSETDSALTSINSPREIWLMSLFQRRQWNVRTGDPLSIFSFELDYAARISPDGNTVLINHPDGALDLWDIHRKRIRSRLKADREDAWNGFSTFSLDGKMLAYVGDDLAIHVWKNNQSAWRRFFASLPLGRSLLASNPHFKFKRRKTEAVGALTFSPDGKILAHTGTLLGTVNTIIQLNSTETGETLSTFTVLTERLDALVFSPDGKKLAGGNQEAIYLWDASTGAQLGVCTPEHLGTKRTLVFSPDSRILISAVGGRVVKFPTGTVKLARGGWISETKSVHGGGYLQLWDASTGELLSIHRAHTDHVKTLAFSKDRKTLATGSADGTILLWDWETLKKVNNR